MKKIALGVGLILILVLGAHVWKAYILEGTVQYVQGKTEVVEKEVVINPLDEQIKQKNKELEELYSNARNLEASVEVREAEIARLQELNTQDRKALADFIQAIASKK